MKRNTPLRKLFAWALCLAMLASLLAVPVLAEGEDAPAAAPAAAESSSASSGTSESASSSSSAKSESAASESASSSSSETSGTASSETASSSSSAKSESASSESASSSSSETSGAASSETASSSSSEKSETASSETASSSSSEAPEAPTVVEDTSASVPTVEAPTVSETAPVVVETTPAVRPVSRPASRPSAVVIMEDTSSSTSAAASDAVVLGGTSATTSSAAAASSFTDDGFTVDWDEVGLMDGGDWQVQKWGIARGEGGYWVYMENDQNQTWLGITYYNNSSDAICYRSWLYSGNTLLCEVQSPIQDSTLTLIQEGNSYRMEGFVPDSFLKADRFIISSGAVTLASEDIYQLDDATEPQGPTNPDPSTGKETPEDTVYEDIGASYDGIVIDGSFDDWAAVPRYDFVDMYDANGNLKDPQLTFHYSVVWDGDWIYILAVSDGQENHYTDWVWDAELGQTVGIEKTNRTGNWNSVCCVGTHGNGQMAIVTDLNQQLLIQPVVNSDGTPGVNGIDGAQAAVNNTQWYGAPHMWEMAIPVSALPKYLESFDFDPYLAGPIISGITDLQGGGATGSFNGIVIDGKYADWDYYPMHTIEYATSGTQDTVRDAHGALWADDNILYGYVATNMESHLQAKGGEFLGDIVLAFNGDRSYKEYPTDGNFYPRILAFDDLDRISPNDAEYTAAGEPFLTLTPGYTMEDGDYTFYIFDTRTAPSAPIYDPDTGTTYYPTVADLKEQAFGVIKIHVDGVLDQAEFQLDLDKVAQYIDKDGDTAFKTIEIQWGRLGQQWIAISGTPTGPIISVALLVGAVGAPMCVAELRKRRRNKKRGDDQADAQ